MLAMNEQDIIQTLATALMVVLNLGGGFVVKSIMDSVRELKKTDAELADKVHVIETLVVGHYLTRQEFDGKFELFSNAMFVKLDKIYDRLERKADKP